MEEVTKPPNQLKGSAVLDEWVSVCGRGGGGGCRRAGAID